jgi:uncharacterized protein YggE
MMKMMLTLFLLCAAAASAPAQEAGNASYGGQRRRTSGVTVGNLSSTEPKDSVQSTFIEANVLMNVKADEYLAVFGLAQEAPTIVEGNRKLDAQIGEFRASLKTLGVEDGDLFVDFVTQNRVYDFGVTGNTARERLSGFEVKKNVAVRYRDRSLLEGMLASAAKASIFDLVKVDYVVRDVAGARERLLEEASKIVRKKEESYARLLGVRLRPQSVSSERYNAFFPSEQYSSYVAYEAGSVDTGGGSTRVLEKRKTSTSYFSPLHTGEFDTVVNPLGAEPAVQLTLFLKVRYTLVP